MRLFVGATQVVTPRDAGTAVVVLVVGLYVLLLWGWLALLAAACSAAAGVWLGLVQANRRRQTSDSLCEHIAELERTASSLRADLRTARAMLAARRTAQAQFTDALQQVRDRRAREAVPTTARMGEATETPDRGEAR